MDTSLEAPAPPAPVVSDLHAEHARRRASRSAGPASRSRKPKKPYPGFPLFPHATGRWAKKVRGRFAFFGPWSDPQGALERWLDQRDVLLAGRVPRRPVPQPIGSTQPPRARADQVREPGGTFAPGASLAGVGDHRAIEDPSAVVADVAAGATFDDRSFPRRRGGVSTEGLTLRDLANRFLTAKRRRVESGELSQRSFGDYHAMMARLLKALGPHRLVADLLPEDFARLRASWAETRGAFALTADITKVRTLFRFAEAEGLIERVPRYGPGFEKPSRKTIRKARAGSAARMFEPEEIARLLALAKPQLRAMILLGLNAGMGNTDLSALPSDAVNLKTGLLDFPRPKTGVERRAPLWPETIAALEEVASVRPAARSPEAKGLVFVTKYGKAWVRVQAPDARRRSASTAVAIDGIGLEFGKLMREAGVYTPGRGFYALRHTFRTVADESADRRAIDLIMGHENGRDVSAHYVERISAERLEKVVEHVRRWVFPTATRVRSKSRQRVQTRSDLVNQSL